MQATESGSFGRDVGKPLAVWEGWAVILGIYGDQAPRSAEIAPWTSPMMTELSPPLLNTGRPVCLASLPDTGVGLWARPSAGPGNWMLPPRQDLHGSDFSVSSRARD